MIVVGTHIDSIPSSSRPEAISRLKARFRELYIAGSANSVSYPIISGVFLVNSYDNKFMDKLRNGIYELAGKYKLPGTCTTVIRVCDQCRFDVEVVLCVNVKLEGLSIVNYMYINKVTC